MSDDPTRAGRPLWGPVRRPGEVPAPGPVDEPAPVPEPWSVPAAPGGHPAAGSGEHRVDGQGSTTPAGPPWPTAVAQGPWTGGVAETRPAPPFTDTGADSGWAPAPAGMASGPATLAQPGNGNPYAGTLGGDLYGAPSGPVSSPFAETRQRVVVPPQGTGPDAARTPPPPVPPGQVTSTVAGGWSRARLVAVTVTCAVALLIAGSGVVWAMNRVPEPAADAASVSPASVAPAPAPSTASSDPTVRSSSGLVQVDAVAAANPLARPVAELLDRHFTSINTRDYSTWVGTVSSRRAADQSAEQWRSDYRSTRDGDVVVTSISDGGGAVTVGLRFTSQQDVVDAPSDLPAGKICWTSRWPITGLPSAGTIGTAPKGTTSKQAC